jgi:hypothetical protein
MKKIIFFSLPVLFLLIFTSSFWLIRPSQSANLINVKDTLSSSQLSYFARLSIGHSNGATVLNIGYSAPFITTTNLFVGDTVAVGQGATTTNTNYVVTDIYSSTSFGISSPLQSVNTAAQNSVIATHTATHTISFTPINQFVNGVFEVLIKATNSGGSKHQDGIPDQDGFDLGMDVGSTVNGPGTRLTASDISCPFGATAGVGTTSIGSNLYHLITCTLSAGATNPLTSATITIGTTGASGSELINPTAATGHTPGTADSTADVYTFYVRHRSADGSTIDSTQGKIAVVEAVRVTATIDPTLTFSIGTSGVGSGNSTCGVTLGTNAANTTATSVAFGSLNINAFNTLSHHLSCVTNADDGYVVTVYETAPMRNIATGTTIPDTNCDGSCSSATAAIWNTDVSHSEWGYSIQNINVGVTDAGFTNASPYSYKAFGIGPGNAQQIMKNTDTPSSTETAFICYRVTASTTQEAGNYENEVIYTATATF